VRRCQRIKIIRLKRRTKNEEEERQGGDARLDAEHLCGRNGGRIVIAQQGSSWCPWPSCECPWPLPPLCCWTLIESFANRKKEGLLFSSGRAAAGASCGAGRVLASHLAKLLGRIDQHVRSHAVVADGRAEMGAGELRSGTVGWPRNQTGITWPGDGVPVHAEQQGC